MPEFKTSISESATDFGKVRSATPTVGKGEAVAKGLSAVVQGVATFGKSSARSAGAEAALEQGGMDLDLATVNTDVDNINDSIQRNLSIRQDEIGGALSQRQVQESKDRSLRALDLTDRHIQGLIDAGTLTSTEGNARRRMALAQKMNEGSNFLFKDEFINAMSSVTGGAKGSASQAFFPKTSDEIRSEAIAKEQNKAIAEYEGKKAGLMALTGRSEDQIDREMKSAETNRKFLAELEAKKGHMELNANEIAQQVDAMQSLATQTMEQEIAGLTVNGVLEPESISTTKTSISSHANNLRMSLANNKGLSASARKLANTDIDEWETGSNARIDSLSKVNYNKTLLADLENIVKITGIKAFPDLAILSKVNPQLAAEISKIPTQSVASWTKLRTTGDQEQALLSGIRAISQMSQGKPVKDAGGLTLALQTASGVEDASNPDSANAPAWKRSFAEAPSESLVSLRGAFAKKAANWDKDVNVRNKIVDHYNLTKDVLMNRISYTGTSIPQVVLKPTPENIAGISAFHKTQFNATMDISDELAQYPDTVSIIEQGYNTFKEHPWLWGENYENAADGYNAFLKSEFALKNGLEEPKPKSFMESTLQEIKDKEEEQAPVKKQEPEKDEPISVRHNNPGNLRSFGDVPTVDTPSGKFAKFKSVEEGTRALARDLDTKRLRGDNTIGQILSQYSPDTDPENVKRGLKVEDYIAFAEKSTGIKRDRALESDEDVAKLMRAIIDFESGRGSGITEEQILQGIADAKRS